MLLVEITLKNLQFATNMTLKHFAWIRFFMSCDVLHQSVVVLATFS
jgi:hypothetical protein